METLPFEQIPSWLTQFLSCFGPTLGSLVAQYPVIASIMTIVGFMRLVFKPICSLIWMYIENSPSTKDNEIMEKIKNNIVFKIFVYILDWTASIKVKK